MIRHPFSEIFTRIYAIMSIRRLVLKIVYTLEGGQIRSVTLRKILKKYYNIEAGAYSYGEGLSPGAFPRGVKIGNYVSIGPGVRVFLRNHPSDRLSMHPFFYNSQLGVIQKDNVFFGSLEIGHDCWIGANVIVTPGCHKIGIGSIVAAGSVVTKDVPDLAIVGGVPAKVIKYRFETDEERELYFETKWWEMSMEKLVQNLQLFIKPFSIDEIKVNLNNLKSFE